MVSSWASREPKVEASMGPRTTVTPEICAVRLAQEAVAGAAAHEVELVGGASRRLGQLADSARVAAGKGLDDDAHIRGHRIGTSDPWASRASSILRCISPGVANASPSGSKTPGAGGSSRA